MLSLYRLKFLSKSTPVRAYTLFGAICWIYRLIGGDLEKLLNDFKNGNPPFIISSPFPIAESSCGLSLVFPKPVLVISDEVRRDYSIYEKIRRKPIKKARYVSFSVFKRILEGEVKEERFISDPEKFEETEKVIVQRGDKACFKDFGGLSVRNVLNRVTMKSENLFTEEYHLFSDKWFLVKFYDNGFKPMLEECFKLIEDTGLGANKNLGWGNVKIEPLEGFDKEMEYLEKKVNRSEKFITLSPVIPKNETIDIDNSTYEYEIYKSPIDTTFGEALIWKRKVLYLNEGSVLKRRGDDEWVGCVKDVGAGDIGIKAYQYGYEFPVAVGG